MSKGSKILTIPMTGKLVTSEDGAVIGDGNYQTLTNLRYNPASGRPQGVRGMQAVNTTAISNPDLRSMFHFQNDDSDESHLLAQGVSGTAGAIYDCKSALPAGGEFTSIFTESASSSTGRFSKAPAGYMAYANGKDTCLFGGSAATVGSFINCNPYYSRGYQGSPPTTGDLFYYDYTDSIRNTLSDSKNIATIYATDSGTTYSGWAYLFIGTPMPANGFTFTFSSAATSSGTASVNYCTAGYGYNFLVSATSVSDGTSTGGVTCGQDGTISFTAADAAPAVVFNKSLYWYRVVFKGPSGGAFTDSVKISNVVASIPMQSVKDIWDGATSPILYWAKYTSAASAISDETLNVFENYYDASDPTTYSQINHTSGTTSYIQFSAGLERLQGINIYIAPEYGATETGGGVLRYWNGTAFTDVTQLEDYTREATGDGQFTRTGLLTWHVPSIELESRYKGPNQQQNTYNYEIKFQNVFTSNISARVYYVECIRAPKEIGPKAFPVYGINRLWLCEGNTAICSNAGTANAFNGDDSAEFTFGSNEDLTAGAALFNQRGSDYHNVIAFFKKSEIWVIVGENFSNWVQYQVSNNIGCPAPGTLVSVNIPQIGDSAGGNVLLWQGATGIHLFDGTGIINLHDDIANLFDQRDANAIDLDAVDTAVAWFDQREVEYHWSYASKGNTAPNKEWAFSFRKMGWFEVDRKNKVQAACQAQDSKGNVFTYGADSSGFVYQLESGATWDGSAITHTLRTGDIILNKNPMLETQVRKVRHICVGANSTTDSIAMTHYIDTASAGKEYTLDPDWTGYRIAKPTKSFGATDPGIFHSFELELDTSAESYGYEPIMLGIEFDETRKAQG